MKKSIIQVMVYEGDDGYVFASCPDLSMVTQAKTLDELVTNIREAVALALEDEDLDELGYMENPSILLNFELSKINA